MKRYSVGRQTGVALILVLLTLLLSTGSYVLLSAVSGTSKAATDLAARTKKLLRARRALLSYTVSYADNYLPTGAGPGHLPCPDRSPINDGNAGNDGPNPPCRRSGANIGRFPRFTYSRDPDSGGLARKRIEFYPEQSLQDQQMWYAVSPSHINNPVNTVVNPSTRALLRVDLIDNVAAVIIEPGKDQSLVNALRPGDRIEAYLEGENADEDLVFSQAVGGGGNDLLAYITASELMETTRMRVAEFIKRWIREYNQRNCGLPERDCYPAAANVAGDCQTELESGYLPLNPGSCTDSLALAGLLDNIESRRHWFIRNQWPDYFRYRRSPACAAKPAADCEVLIAYPEGLQDAAMVTVAPVEAPPREDNVPR